MKIGLFVGKFLPPHIGHINAIKNASKNCDKLYVVVCSDDLRCEKLCRQANIPFIDLETKTKWIQNELKGLDSVIILSFSENGIPQMPFGWLEWSKRLKEILPEKVDIIFGSERDYEKDYKKYFPECLYVLQDEFRKEINISSTKIRQDPKKYFDYICKSAQPFFKKFLS